MSTALHECLCSRITLESQCKESVIIKNVQHSWGKFCKDDRMPCQEIQPSDIDGTVIEAKKTYAIYTSGRQGSASGTTGSFDLYTSSGDKIATVSWDSPWGAGTKNEVKVTDVSPEWVFSLSPYSPTGAIIITIKFAHVE